MDTEGGFLLKRVAGYTLVGILAMVTGAVIGGTFYPSPDREFIVWQVALFTATITALSLPYFIEYAKNATDAREVGWLLWAVALLFAMVGGLAFFILFPGDFNQAVRVTVGQVLAIAVWVYAYHRSSVGPHVGSSPPIIRRTLLPIMLFSVAIFFYQGYSFTARTYDSIAPTYWRYGAPFIVFLIYFLTVVARPRTGKASGTSSKGTARYVLANAFALAGLVTLALNLYEPTQVNRPTVSTAGDYLSILAIGIVLSIWMGSFEAMKITHVEYRRQLVAGASQAARETSFYVGTAIALTLVVLTIPFLLLLFPFFWGLFFFTALIFGLLILFVWLWRGRKNDSFLRERWRKIRIDWGTIRVVAGYGTLLIIAIDSSTQSLVPQWPDELNDFFSVPVLLALLWIFAHFVKALTEEYEYFRARAADAGEIYGSDSDNFRRVIRRVYEEPRNIARTLGALSFIAFAGLFIWGLIAEPDSDLATRLRAAQILYISASVGCMFFDYAERIMDFNGARRPPDTGRAGSLMLRVSGLVRVTRLPTSALIALIAFAPIAFRTGDPAGAALISAPFLLFSMAGFALNDFLDAKVDAVSKPSRAIPSGHVTAAAALSWAFVTGILGALVSVVAVPDPWTGIFYASYAILAAAYNYVIRQVAALKTVTAAAICVLPLFFALYQSGATVPLVALGVGVAFLYLMGRELRMDVLDIEGDKFGGIRSVAVVHGEGLARRLATALIGTSLLLLSIVMMVLLPTGQGLAAVTVLFALQALGEYQWRSKNRLKMRRSILVQWGVMLTGVGLLLSV